MRCFPRSLALIHLVTSHHYCPALQIEEFQRGDYIIRKGEEGHTFYMIRKGTCVATNIPNNEPDVSIAEGNYFGERALLMNEPRAADVVAASDHVRAPLRAATLWHRHRHRLEGDDAHAARGVASTLLQVVLLSLERDDFHSLLGPLEDVLVQNL